MAQPLAQPRPSKPRTKQVDTTNWPTQAADTIERVVQGVRDKTTGPAIGIARWLVAGLLVLLVGTMVGILLVAALVRVLDAYLPEAVFGQDHVWAAHALVGLPLFLGGLVLLSQRRSRAEA